MDLDALACYRAITTHDARFDGRFVTGVTSTGIYCRPICRVKLPRRENCRFFAHPAAAEAAGFRPCLRCRPELAPREGNLWSLQDASRVLAMQAAQRLDDLDAWHDTPASVAALAAALGVSDRHLRRIMGEHLGVSPMQYLQTRRLLSAKQLLTDTRLSVAQVAAACGFASRRRFHAVFAQRYGLSPAKLRRAQGSSGEGPADPAKALRSLTVPHLARASNPAHPSFDARGPVVRLAYRPPYDAAAMLAFLRARAAEGLELQRDRCFARTVRIQDADRHHEGWLAVVFDARYPQVELRVSASLEPVLSRLIPRVRALLDLDADMQAIDAVLGAFLPQAQSVPLPGSLDGFELAVRAVLGQQISVAAARTLVGRLVGELGLPLREPLPGLSHTFPSPSVIAAASPDTLGRIGIIRQRQTALRALACAVRDGHLRLHPGAPLEPTLSALGDLPGIGPWTVQYIAMRALRWPDAFPAGDVALHKAMGLRKHPRAAQTAAQLAQAWRPWRAYGVIRTWHALAADPDFRLTDASFPGLAP